MSEQPSPTHPPPTQPPARGSSYRNRLHEEAADAAARGPVTSLGLRMMLLMVVVCAGAGGAIPFGIFDPRAAKDLALIVALPLVAAAAVGFGIWRTAGPRGYLFGMGKTFWRHVCPGFFAAGFIASLVNALFLHR